MARAKSKSSAQPLPSASETTFAPRPTSDVSVQRPRALVHEPLPAVNLNPADLLAYERDLLERSVLFFDTLRKRANNMLEHERAGLPSLLNFEHELLLDARRFDRPANYALVRVTDVGDACWEDCVDPAKPPVIVIDPRGRHGPGIGGFKRDSEVGIALHVGHPVYFVVFFPEPCPGQTLSDVLSALARFVDFVAERHEGRRPVLYGNCQAGWAATLLSARCEAGAGTAVLNGSPLSYWAGEPGVNPIRTLGGFVGGVWLAHFLADLNQNRFDGAWLVQNFEGLKPGNAIWDKYANLLTKIDTEQDRFLEFERWWNGYYRLSGEEIVAIIEDLFVGNKLEQGEVRIDDHCAVDLKRLRSPLVIFASYGDNITPPHQALRWIPVVYATTEDLKRAGQRIVYLTNPHVGHLGIFVARREDLHGPAQHDAQTALGTGVAPPRPGVFAPPQKTPVLGQPADRQLRTSSASCASPHGPARSRSSHFPSAGFDAHKCVLT